jgi:hypothetical protein
MRSALCLLPLLAGCASYMQKVEPTGPPGPDEAKVVFCRPSRFLGGGVEFPLWDGEKLVGFSEHGCTVEYRCAPGEHFFLTMAQSYKGLNASLAGGNTYYLWVTPRVGAWTAAVGLTPVRKEDAELLQEVRASLQDTEYRAPVPEECGPYEEKRRERTRAAIEKFRAGEYTAEPPLRADDGHREPIPPRS